MKKTQHLGLTILLLKIGPKLLPLLVKLKETIINLAKSAVGVKGLGVAGSVGLYGYLFTWQMGIALALFIGIHEYGHLWAMRRCGLRTRGMFFIPGFGAVAVAEERFGSARNEAFIAIMGPIFGFAFFIVPAWAYWYAAGNEMFAAFAAVGTFVNLINLLTIMPLDGGRMLKSLAYSENHGRSFIITCLISTATTIVAGFAGFFLFVYMAFIGLMEVLQEYGIRERLQHVVKSLLRAAIGFAIFVLTQYLVFGNWQLPKNWLAVSIVALVLFLVSFALVVDIWRDESGLIAPLIRYPIKVVQGLFIGAVELLSLRWSHIQPIENYTVMAPEAKWRYGALFLGTIAAHAAMLFSLSVTPEGALMGDMLK